MQSNCTHHWTLGTLFHAVITRCWMSLWQVWHATLYSGCRPLHPRLAKVNYIKTSASLEHKPGSCSCSFISKVTGKEFMVCNNCGLTWVCVISRYLFDTSTLANGVTTSHWCAFLSLSIYKMFTTLRHLQIHKEVYRTMARCDWFTDQSLDSWDFTKYFQDYDFIRA